MLYIIDTADLNAIRRCNDLYPVAGVTTNPTIIAHEHTDFIPLITEIRKIIGPEKMLHVQTTAQAAEDIVREAHLLRELLGGEFYIKIPCCAEGLKATKILSRDGINVTETAIFTQQQALVAARAGAKFVAPYVNRLDNIVSDGVNVVGEITQLFKTYHLGCRVLAASFKTVEQVHKVAMLGCDTATIAPELFDKLIYHPMSDVTIEGFRKDWQSVYGDKTVEDLIVEARQK